MTIAEQILGYLQQNRPVSTKQLASALGISPRTIAHNLSILTANGQVLKVGKQPNIVYSLGQDKSAVTQQTLQVATPALTPNSPQAGPEVVIIEEVKKTAKAAPEPLGKELLPNWCQKFNIDPAVVTARYEAVRGFIPGLSPRARSSAKKKLLAVLYSGIVLALVFLSVLVQKTGRWSPILKIAGLILIVGIIYMVVFQHHRFTPHQSRLWRDQNQSSRLEEQLITSQEETARLKAQLADNQNELSQTKEQLSSIQNELDKTKDQFNSNQQQLTKEQEKAENLGQQLKVKEKEAQSLRQKVSELDEQKRILQEPTAESQGLGQVTIEQIMDWTKEGVSSDEIIHRIKTSRSTYGLQAEDTNYLREHGVSDGVIETMQSMR